MNIINKISTIVANTLLEKFDFNEVADPADKSIDISSNLQKSVLKNMYKNKIDPKYVLQNIYQVDISNYDQLLTYDKIKRKILHLNDDLFLGYTSYANNIKSEIVGKTLINIKWQKIKYNNINNSAITYVIDTLLDTIAYSYNEPIDDFKNSVYEDITIYISPDKGMCCICCDFMRPTSLYLSELKGHISDGYFIFTGLVNYQKVKNISNFEQDIKVKKWFKNLMNNYGCEFIPSNHYNLIYDKNGYPRIYAFITQSNLWSVLPDAAYKSIMSKGWTEDIKTPEQFKQHILRRRNTTDEVLQFGIFYPWDIRAFVKSDNFYLFSRKTSYSEFFRESHKISEDNINNYGLVVFQLGVPGKMLYNEKFKQK